MTRFPHHMLSNALAVKMASLLLGLMLMLMATAEVRAAGLTEDQALQLAFSHSRKLDSYGTSVQIAEHREDSAGWVRNPELRIMDLSTRYFTDEFDELGLGLRWRPPELGELGVDEQEARVRLWDRKVREIRYRAELADKVRRTFANVVMLDELARLAERRLRLEAERIAVVEQLFNVGRRSVVYFHKAKLWMAESKNERTQLARRRSDERRELATILGTDTDIPLAPPELPEVDLPLERLIEIAYSNRPEIQLVQQQKELANREYRQEMLKPVPWINYVQLTYHLDAKDPDWGEMLIGFELPLFNWNLGNIRATKLAAERRESQTGAAQESIESEVRESYMIYQEALNDYNSFRENSASLIGSAQGVVDTAREQGVVPGDEVFEMELLIVQTQRLLVEKRRRLAHALSDLFLATGVSGYREIAESGGND